MRRAIGRCNKGAVAVEFALISPALIMLIVGTLYVGLAMYAATGLHNAAEAAARCYSVNSSRCGTAAATQTYALNYYYGTGTPTFTASIAACGHQVSATSNFVLSAGLKTWSIPLSATACFP